MKVGQDLSEICFNHSFTYLDLLHYISLRYYDLSRFDLWIGSVPVYTSNLMRL
jgi:hypothetical protein